MPTPRLPDHVLDEAVAAVKKYGGVVQAARALNLPRSTLEGRILEARRRAENVGSPDAPRYSGRKPPSESPTPAAEPPTPDQATAALQDQIFELKAQLRSVRANTLNDEYVRRKIIGLQEQVELARPPDWVIRPVRGKTLPGVPVACWSDWHWGEVVDPGQIGGVNEFDLAIAARRARTLVERTIYLLTEHVVNPSYPGIIVNLGGDMMSGDIHDELTATNELPFGPVMLDLFGVLRWAIGTLADRFGKVYLPCVAGNHGRTTRKPRAKDRAFTNNDWLLCNFLARSFEGDDRVRFYIPDGPDALYSVYGWRYLLTHGDQFRGGDGMIGHFGPVLRGQKKKQTRNAAIGQAFDVMIHGHFHTYFPTQSIIGNGSLKGYDEYANSENFAYEAPMQALWLTHPEYGVTMHMPVYLEPRATHVADAEWVRSFAA